MLTLSGINATPFQTFRVPIDEGTIIISLNYRASVKMWFIGIEYEDLIVKGIRVCSNLNLLQQYANIVPFGLLVNIIEGVEPIEIDDFSKGRVTLNILTSDEVERVEDYYKGLRAV